MAVNQKQSASVAVREATSGSYELMQRPRGVGHDDAGRRGRPGCQSRVAEPRADFGEGLVDERLEALTRPDREAAHGVGGIEGHAHGAVTSSGRASRPSARRTARPSATQRVDHLPIVAAVCARATRELTHERRATLPARALEAALTAQRRERLPARGARGSQRAGLAAWHPSEAHLRTEVEERLVPIPRAARRRLGVDRSERALEHAPHVRVERRDLGVEGEARDRACRVRADAG